MSICDRCIHDEVCGLEDNHEEAITFCAYMKPNDVLDKIRAEILDEAEYAYADFEQYKVDYLGADAEYVEDELPQDDFRYGMERVIEIIDKYKAKSEDKCIICANNGMIDDECAYCINHNLFKAESEKE